jgi:ectoine hydroxylase
MTQTETDVYPTRGEAPAVPLERRDPVLHGGPAATGPLTPQQLQDYERDGFVFLEGLFDAPEVALLHTELERLLGSEEVRQSELSITEPSSGAIRSIFAAQTVSEVFDRLSRDMRLTYVARQLLHSEVYLHQTRVNFKPGFVGKEFYWHSDFETWHAEDGMPRMRAVSCSITLTENNVLNGPLMLIPGSHRHFVPCVGHTPEDHYRMSLKRQEYGVPDQQTLRALAEANGIAAPTGPAGSVLFFECNVLHGSNGNITPYPRSNAFFVYNSVENALEAPFAAEKPRPWFLANRDATAIAPSVSDSAVLAEA